MRGFVELAGRSCNSGRRRPPVGGPLFFLAFLLPSGSGRAPPHLSFVGSLSPSIGRASGRFCAPLAASWRQLGAQKSGYMCERSSCWRRCEAQAGSLRRRELVLRGESGHSTCWRRLRPPADLVHADKRAAAGLTRTPSPTVGRSRLLGCSGGGRRVQVVRCAGLWVLFTPIWSNKFSRFDLAT